MRVEPEGVCCESAAVPVQESPGEEGGRKVIKIENTDVIGWEHAIRGMRNPLESWDKSDSCMSVEAVEEGYGWIGENDLSLMMKLRNAGSDERKFMRMIIVYVDITAPLYWWKEFDTYKVGTVANSCSTMHKIHAKEFTLDDFSYEHLCISSFGIADSVAVLQDVICTMNYHREMFLETKKKEYWWDMIQLLPTSYNQKRTVMLNYEVLTNMYHARKAHKLDEWREFCRWIESLPYPQLITGES